MTLPEHVRALCDRFRVAENGVHGKAILAALETTRREAWEEAAKIVDQCNLEGPYQAIGAAARIRALAEPIVSAWPIGCHDPTSCGERHRSCMYLGCRHEGRDITSEIDAATPADDRS